MAEFSKNPALYRLPHPLRCQACLGDYVEMFEQTMGTREWGILQTAFADDEFLLANLPQLIDQYQLSRFRRLFETAAHAPGSTELGGAMATVVGIRHLVSPYRLFRFDDELVSLLGMTDLAQDIPVSFLQPPFPRCYVELGQRRDIDAFVSNELSGNHVLEGAYVESGVHPGHGRGLYVLATGSPLGKSDCMDDSTHAVFISTQNPEKSLSQALDDAFTASMEQSTAGGYRVPDRGTFNQSLLNLQWLVKALLYLGLPDIRRTLHLERSALVAELAGLKSPGKRAKLTRRIARASDTIVIHAPGVPSEAVSGAESMAARSAHWRRGHYRNQPHGPGRRDHKLIFIAPMRISGKEPAAVLPEYRVR